MIPLSYAGRTQRIGVPVYALLEFREGETDALFIENRGCRVAEAQSCILQQLSYVPFKARELHHLSFPSETFADVCKSSTNDEGGNDSVHIEER
jgi:hypothetical protein